MRSADQELQFRFGQFACRVTGSGRLIGRLPVLWKEYLPSRFPSSAAVVLHVEEGEAASGQDAGDGWAIQDHCEVPQAACIRNGKAVFALQYGSFPEITVRITDAAERNVRLGIRYGLMLALYQSCIGLHGVTLLCGDEIIVLSAPSGTGKTTLAHLLETYADAITINGDFALLSCSEEGVIFEPTPFCGTSGRCLNHRVRVNRVVFLEQSKTNLWRCLTGREALIRFMDNAFVPTWDERMRQAVQENIIKCVSSLDINAFSFAPAREAAETFSHRLRIYEDPSS